MPRNLLFTEKESVDVPISMWIPRTSPARVSGHGQWSGSDNYLFWVAVQSWSNEDRPRHHSRELFRPRSCSPLRTVSRTSVPLLEYFSPLVSWARRYSTAILPILGRLFSLQARQQSATAQCVVATVWTRDVFCTRALARTPLPDRWLCATCSCCQCALQSNAWPWSNLCPDNIR